MSEYGFGAVPNELLDRKDARIAEMEAGSERLLNRITKLRNRITELAEGGRRAEAERDEALQWVDTQTEAVLRERWAERRIP